MVVMNFEKDFVKMCCINIVGQCVVYYCEPFHSRKEKKIHGSSSYNARNCTVLNDNKFPELTFSYLSSDPQESACKKIFELFSYSFG